MARTALPAQLTQDEAAATLQQLVDALAALPAGETLEVDAAALQTCDSSAVSVLIGLRRRARAAARPVRLLQPPARLLDLARVYGVLELLQDPAAA